MLQTIFVSPHPAGNCQLILGSHSAILMDCGISFCAVETVEQIKKTLGCRPLSAIILSHSHYDHITGLPWIRQAFPDVPVYAHPYTKAVFAKAGALATIQQLCRNAQMLYGAPFHGGDFSNAQLETTHLLTDGKTLPFDDSYLQVIFTPGHTKDAVSVDFPSEKITWICETLGVPRPDGRVQPCFLSSYLDTLNSLERISHLGERQYIVSHTSGVLSLAQSAEFLALSQEAVTHSAELIAELFRTGKDYDGIFEGYAKQYWSELYRPVWPFEAFSMNTAAAIKAVLNELCGQQL